MIQLYFSAMVETATNGLWVHPDEEISITYQRTANWKPTDDLGCLISATQAYFSSRRSVKDTLAPAHTMKACRRSKGAALFTWRLRTGRM
jgi:hypothetical protein